MESHWRKAWDRDGLIHIPNALDQTQVTYFLERLDALYASFRAGETENFSIGDETATIMPGLWTKLLASQRQYQTYKKWNIIALDSAFIPLLDHDAVFPIIVDLMGINIQLFRSELIIVPPGVSEKAYIHTDSGTLGRTFADRRFPPLMASVQYFLTDLTDDDCGNFAYVPGTQHTPFPEESDNEGGDQANGFVQGQRVEGRIQTRARAGDAVIFPHSLWHGANGNSGGDARKSIIIGYAQSFVRPYDYIEQSTKTLEACRTARQRRLIGDLGGWAWRPGCLHHPAPDHEAVMRGAE